MSERQNAHRQSGHRSGKLVVLAIIGLGLALGVVGMLFRPARVTKPTTQPSTHPTSIPSPSAGVHAAR